MLLHVYYKDEQLSPVYAGTFAQYNIPWSWPIEPQGPWVNLVATPFRMAYFAPCLRRPGNFFAISRPGMEARSQRFPGIFRIWNWWIDMGFCSINPESMGNKKTPGYVWDQYIQQKRRRFTPYLVFKLARAKHKRYRFALYIYNKYNVYSDSCGIYHAGTDEQHFLRLFQDILLQLYNSILLSDRRYKINSTKLASPTLWSHMYSTCSPIPVRCQSTVESWKPWYNYWSTFELQVNVIAAQHI